MIRLHRLNGNEVVINAELVETVEAAPDTVISLANGNRFVVKETLDQVLERILEYRRAVTAQRKDPVAHKEP